MGYPLSVFSSFIYNFVFYQVYVFGRGYADKNIDIPYHMIAISLISFVIPMAIGVFVKHKKPELADRIQSLVSRFTFLNYSHFALEKRSNKKQLFKGIKKDTGPFLLE